MTDAERIERLKQMLLRMCESMRCADCPLGVDGCELAAEIGYRRVPNDQA
jgi:hypothetical protein